MYKIIAKIIVFVYDSYINITSWLNWYLKKQGTLKLKELSDKDEYYRKCRIFRDIEPREVWHKNNQYKFLKNQIKSVREKILFCDAEYTENLDKKLQVNYAPKNVDADISVNLFHIWKPNDVYKTKEEFIKALKMFIPAELKETNGFLSIKLNKELFSNSLGFIRIDNRFDKMIEQDNFLNINTLRVLANY